MRYGDAITRLPDGMKTEEEWLTDTLVYLDRRSREADDDRGFKDEIAMACSRLADLQVSNNVSALDKDDTGDRSATRAIALFEAAEPAAQILDRELKRFSDQHDLRTELGSIAFLTGQLNASLLALPNKNRTDSALDFFGRAHDA